ncbi:MAG: 2-phospho-L-lactate transferase [Actinomycetota bacterium]|nr:2-phospho-L-lactate transferase [Actinomycetota bacterium]
MKVTAKVTVLAGGVGAGKFLRGLVRAVPPEDLTVIVNTADDIRMHGLYVSPDVDSVTYWLGDVADRERGWGRAGETFRATEELKALGAPDAWFGLGDLDLATHLFRTAALGRGVGLATVTAAVARHFGVPCRLLPMSEDPVTTRIDAVDEHGRASDLHFQEYWVLRGARDDVKGIRYDGAATAGPAPGVLEAIEDAGTIVVCPSNPVASIGPILAVPAIGAAVRERRDRVVGVSPIVAGAPLRGMADRLMPAAGFEVSAVGAAAFYEGSLAAWVIDERDRGLASRVEALGLRVGVTDSIMDDDGKAESLARAALGLL